MKGKTMKKQVLSLLAAASVGTAALLGGAAPAAASPALGSATAVAPTLGMGAGAYSFWCMLGYCKTKTVCDRTIGCQKLICANSSCTRFIFR